MNKYRKGLLGLGAGLFLTGWCALNFYVEDLSLNQAIKYPEKRLGFVWKREYKDHPENCLADESLANYKKFLKYHIVREYCITRDYATSEHTRDMRKVCRNFVINKDCIDHFVE